MQAAIRPPFWRSWRAMWLLDPQFVVEQPSRCGYQSLGRYEANLSWSTPKQTRAVGILVTGSGHSSTSWLTGWLSEHAAIRSSAPVKDTCLKDTCSAQGVDERAATTLLKGPCNVCYLPFLLNVCANLGTRIIGLVRNPLDHWHSLCRRDPATPHHNLLRWVNDI